ncbi:hypothetical protein [Caulobacter sp. UNC279MFTsu5.1]|uniref:hypothetical protein n=1 Tax=Caulobacter sp. UNC279MFTsu5.1 TaxID=1502775 RepID=UPI0008F1B088|nr:hypothetical protein [Caulobacter sp. UNC279MFTsu5.1]SFK59916.1 hypothetical protein SAMN02799626_04696 [Caulobacter sp. UNC279MFTsu5.1]
MLTIGSSIMASFSASALARLNAATAPKAAPSSDAGLSAAPPKSAKDEFMEYAKLTPAQKMRAAMLARMGLTEEQVKAMSPEDRKKVEDQIKQQIKEQVENDPKKAKGSLLDVSA